MKLYTCVFAFFCAFFSKPARAQQDMGQMTAPVRPITTKSNESTKKQLALAMAEGDSVNKCIAWLLAQSTAASGQANAAEYKITYAVSSPEGWYELSNNTPHWKAPSATDGAHLWVFVQDGADNRIVPPLTMRYKLTNSNGSVTSQGVLPFAWMPLLNGYGINVQLSGTDTYTLALAIEPPGFRRHDPYNGDRFTQATTVVASIAIDPQKFSSRPLSEAMEAQQELSAQAGKAYANTVQGMYKQANDGRDTVTGDYIVAYAIEYAEGYWHYEGDKFRYMAENDMSGKTNTHVEISVRDAGTGRFMHDLDITAQLKDARGTIIGTMKEPFMWHPWLYHYGENWRIPKSGTYDLVLHIQPPAYHRYGKTAGQHFSQSINLTFHHITLKTGQK